MEIRDLDINKLLPQQVPFVMVDRLLFTDNVSTRTEFLIRSDNLLVKNGKFSEMGIIENFAQTCAARRGYIQLMLQLNAVTLGFIGAVRNFKLNYRPIVGDVLTTEIEVKSEVFNITLVSAKSWVNEKLIAECEMKISI